MKKIINYTILCLYFASAANAQERCQYKADEIDEINGIEVLKSSGQPINGVVCLHNDNLDV